MLIRDGPGRAGIVPSAGRSPPRPAGQPPGLVGSRGGTSGRRGASVRHPLPVAWIGFALRICPPVRATAHTTTAFTHIPHALQVWLCSAHLPSGRATPHTTTAFAHIPQALHVWVRFAHSPSGRAKLGSFCAFHSPAGPHPMRGLPLPIYPCPPKFGFVLRIRPPAGRNWVRFARFAAGRQPPARNWLRFAHLPRVPRPCGPTGPQGANSKHESRNMSLRGAQGRPFPPPLFGLQTSHFKLLSLSLPRDVCSRLCRKKWFSAPSRTS
jgi:hypothetical protein